MKTEFEATYLDIDKNEIREKLKSLGAMLLRPEYMQRRNNFDLQKFGRNFWEWARVRDEGDKVTMAYKCIPPNATIDDQKEIEFSISDFDLGVDFLENLGAYKTNYSETLRETWELDGVTIDIDTWPHLEPYIEIESSSEENVKSVSKKLGFDYADAKFCGAGEIYQMKYGIHPDKLAIEKGSIRLTFEDPNPFL
ncbi:MAG TPA: CYTH domain-containing protein [Candidatus Paceibacterota bacterium]|nr:CYTH domain-containing protein [Candidatus Paceibacterota bacterium]HMP18875.1 CYTH domain-containing protein [Candidatus Paceibacterota bacterium]